MLATVFIPYPVLIVALFDIFAKLPRPMLVDGSLTLGGNWINTYLPLVVPMFFGSPSCQAVSSMCSGLSRMYS